MTKDANIITKEQSSELWKNYVREQVNLHLESFLETAISGNIGIKYDNHPIVQTLETGPEYDKNRAKSVSMTLVFELEDYINLNTDLYKE